jgi:hypothetical protein
VRLPEPWLPEISNVSQVGGPWKSLAEMPVALGDIKGNGTYFGQIIYGTYLGGRDKECATALGVDNSGNAYVVGRTPSPN